MFNIYKKTHLFPQKKMFKKFLDISLILGDSSSAHWLFKAITVFSVCRRLSFSVLCGWRSKIFLGLLLDHALGVWTLFEEPKFKKPLNKNKCINYILIIMTTYYLNIFIFSYYGIAPEKREPLSHYFLLPGTSFIKINIPKIFGDGWANLLTISNLQKCLQTKWPTLMPVCLAWTRVIQNFNSLIWKASCGNLNLIYTNHTKGHHTNPVTLLLLVKEIIKLTRTRKPLRRI